MFGHSVQRSNVSFSYLLLPFFFSLFFFLFQFVDVTREAIGRRLGQWGARLNDANYQSQSTLVGDTKTKQNKKGHTTRNADEADDKNSRQQKKTPLKRTLRAEQGERESRKTKWKGEQQQKKDERKWNAKREREREREREGKQKGERKSRHLRGGFLRYLRRLIASPLWLRATIFFCSAGENYDFRSAHPIFFRFRFLSSFTYSFDFCLLLERAVCICCRFFFSFLLEKIVRIRFVSDSIRVRPRISGVFFFSSKVKNKKKTRFPVSPQNRRLIVGSFFFRHRSHQNRPLRNCFCFQRPVINEPHLAPPKNENQNEYEKKFKEKNKQPTHRNDGFPFGFQSTLRSSFWQWKKKGVFLLIFLKIYFRGGREAPVHPRREPRRNWTRRRRRRRSRGGGSPAPSLGRWLRPLRLLLLLWRHQWPRVFGAGHSTELRFCNGSDHHRRFPFENNIELGW